MFHMYDTESGDYLDVEETCVGHEDYEEPLVEFNVMNDGQVQIMFNLDKVRIHSLNDGDVVVSLKR